MDDRKTQDQRENNIQNESNSRQLRRNQLFSKTIEGRRRTTERTRKRSTSHDLEEEEARNDALFNNRYTYLY